MDKLFNITSSFKSVDTEKGIKISGLASASGTDRAGDIIPSEAWMKGGLHDFKKNPIILFNHNYSHPIGKATSIEPVEEGLKMEAFISNAAPNGVAELIKDGVLGAFSVGFQIKDADYIEETGGLMIKDAELYEVSVVSVPCNQDATFSLAKSFDSENEYEDFKKTFTHSVDLAGQSLAKEEDNSSNIASGTPDGGNTPQLETQMTKEEMEALAVKVATEAAEKAACRVAVKAAEAETKAQKEAEEAALAVKAVEDQDSAVQAAIVKGLESGTEKLLADVETKMAEKDADIGKIIKGFEKDLEEKAEEIAKINGSKRQFSDRKSGDAISEFGEEFMHAHIMGVMLNKGWNTKAARDLSEKAGVDYTTDTAARLNTEIANRIEKEVQMYTDVSKIFQEIKVNGKNTTLPIQPDVTAADWNQLGVPAGNLESTYEGSVTPAANTFGPQDVTMTVYRLISQTFMDNEVDEEILVGLMPMITDSIARAHALAVDSMCINGNGTIVGLDGAGSTAHGTPIATGGFEAKTLFSLRKMMGKYGVRPSDVVYIIALAEYFDLIDDPEFEDVNLVGSAATKVTGAVGSVYGSPVIVSDSFPAAATGVPGAFAVNPRAFAIPRLRGMTVEQDYEVANQRKVIVGSQSLGFTKLVGDYAGHRSAVRMDLT